MPNNMNRTAKIVGALYLISNVTFLAGAALLIEPILGAADYLVQVSINDTQVILGALLELINGVAYIGIAVLMFPILRQRFESMALGYVALRIIEFVTQIAASVVPLVLVTLSVDLVRVGGPASESLGEFLLATRYWSYELLSLVFSLSALIFYYMLYQTRLVPRFLSIWGLIGSALVLANTLFEIFGIDLGSGISLVTGLPMLLNELFLGIWLIVKGFSPNAAVYDTAGDAAREGELRTS